jgi:nitrate/nitrite transport system substrate-binding protein
VSAVVVPTRRRFLEGATAAAWAGLGCNRFGGHNGGGTARMLVGFLRQTDAASLLMAEELGSYAKNGLAPTLRRGLSPADLVDRLVSGELLAAQLPASVPLARALTSNGAQGVELVTLMVLSHNGAAVTLARDLCQLGQPGQAAQMGQAGEGDQGVKFLDLVALRGALARRQGPTPLTFAVPAIGGTDDLWLRYLLAAAAVPRNRFAVVELPAEQMLPDLREERIVGFAAPDPWPALAVAQDVGFTFATAQDICRHAPRSVLVTTSVALSEKRAELRRLVRAIIEASVWLDTVANRSRALLGETLARRQGLDLDSGPLRARLGSVYDLGCRLGERDFEGDILFFHHAGRVNLPRRADALLALALLTRFRIGSGTAEAVVERTVRDDIYREVAHDMGIRLPDDMKPFVITLDAVRFDPAAPPQWPSLWPPS